MAHGSPRINICNDCNQYILVARFDSDPTCPDCGKLSVQTNKDEMKDKYNLPLFYEFKLSFSNWTKIKQ